jgi:ABC-type multidrug transport system fused ATPase/permease subunit
MLYVLQGSLVGIVGRVGSGKSALLSAVAAELHRAAGRVIVGADVLTHGFGFVTQDAWTQHATLRDNILFGRDFDRRKYDAVISACALNEDLKVVSESLRALPSIARCC